MNEMTFRKILEHNLAAAIGQEVAGQDGLSSFIVSERKDAAEAATTRLLGFLSALGYELSLPQLAAMATIAWGDNEEIAQNVPQNPGITPTEQGDQ